MMVLWYRSHHPNAEPKVQSHGDTGCTSYSEEAFSALPPLRQPIILMSYFHGALRSQHEQVFRQGK